MSSRANRGGSGSPRLRNPVPALYGRPFKHALPSPHSSTGQPEHKPEREAQAPAQAGSQDSSKRKREPQRSASREAPEHQPARALALAPLEHQPMHALAPAQAPREMGVSEGSSLVMDRDEWEALKKHRVVDQIAAKLCRRSAANFHTFEEQQQYAAELVSFLAHEGALPFTPTQRQKERGAARNLKQNANP